MTKAHCTPSRWVLRKALMLAVSLGLLARGGFPGEAVPVGALHVTVAGIKSNAGPIRYALYDSAAGLDKGEASAIRTGTVPVLSLGCTVVLTNVPHGAYAMTVGQDLNNNGKIDWSILGRSEPCGVSNYTNALLWWPSFSHARFLLHTNLATLTIKLN